MDAYENLQKRMNLYPIGLPKSKESIEILKTLFNQEEAKVALSLPLLPLMFSVDKIAKRSRMNKEKCRRILNRLSQEGLIWDKYILGQKRYALLPVIPGLYETQILKKKNLDSQTKKVTKLLFKSPSKKLIDEIYSHPTSLMRVIPVRKSMEVILKVYAYEEVEKVIRKSGKIALADCACRKAYQNCHRPVDVCLTFNFIADFLIERGYATKISLREALKVLKRTEEAGLVHCSMNTKPPVQMICNCCPCCCVILRGLTVHHQPKAVVKANFYAHNIKERCILCGTCLKICPVNAIDKMDKRIYINIDRCIGCGLCGYHCKKGAIRLKRREEEIPPPANVLYLFLRMVKERGKILRSIAGYIDDLRR